VSLVRVRNTAASHGSMTGLGVKWIRGSAIVIYVGPNSAAREAGIQEGDDITRINGKTVWEYKRSEIYDLMEGNEGDVVELVILRRDQAPITARMRLKPEI
ncbi:MAG TPA: PDZ domain-containing protein, partial [Verrucomicrobiae bacterium]